MPVGGWTHGMWQVRRSKPCQPTEVVTSALTKNVWCRTFFVTYDRICHNLCSLGEPCENVDLRKA